MTPRRILAVSVALAALAGCAKKEAPHAAASAPPLPEDVRKVAAAMAPSATPAPGLSPAAASGEAADTGALSASGEFASSVRSELVVKIPGRVGEVMVDVGARVRKGQPLLRLEDDYWKLDVDRAQADLARAAAASQDSARDLERKTALLAKGSVTQAVFDRSKATADQSAAAVDSAKAALGTARQRLADAVLRSPLDGVVLERRADVGERLGDNTVAFVLVQTAPLKLRFRLPERYVASVRPGQPVRAFADPYPGEAFTGTITTAVQAIDPATRTFTVEAEFPNRDGRLRPGLFARVELDPAKSAAVR